MFQYDCLHPSAPKGLDILDDNSKQAEALEDCQAGLG